MLRRRHISYLAALVGIWAVVLFVSFSFLFGYELSRIRSEYNDIHNRIQQHITSKTKLYEVALEGFANHLATAAAGNFENARNFVKLLRAHYPDIYMIEIAERVSHDERAAMEQKMRDAGYAEFAIHTFGYESDRQAHPSAQKPVYYPIVFIEPELPHVMEVLGLDLSETSSNLTDALERSFHRRGHVASKPFDLMEGGRGYLMYRAVASNPQSTVLEQTPNHGIYALLVVDTSMLIPDWSFHREGLSVSLRYDDVQSSADRTLVEFSNARTDDQALQGVFPVLSKRTSIDSLSQPFALSTRFHIRWRDIDFRIVITCLLVTIITLLIAFRVTVTLYQRKLESIAEKERLFIQANYDALTGLPNESLLQDRFQQAVNHARRSHENIAVLYIDFDRFKEINDRYGHTLGDRLIKRAAGRITTALRKEDTVARLHGDEFVALLSGIASRTNAGQIVNKLRTEFERPFLLNGQPVPLRLSIGVAIFPEDGDTIAALLHASDQDMYDAKRRNRLQVVRKFASSTGDV